MAGPFEVHGHGLGGLHVDDDGVRPFASGKSQLSEHLVAVVGGEPDLGGFGVSSPKGGHRNAKQQSGGEAVRHPHASA